MREQTKKELVSYLFLAGFLVAMRAWQDVQENGWHDSSLCRRLDHLAAATGLDEVREQLRFRRAVKQTLANINVYTDTEEDPS